MERLLFAVFNFVMGCVMIWLLIRAAQETTYPPAVGLALALLFGGTVIFFGTGVPLYAWWRERQERPRGGRQS